MSKKTYQLIYTVYDKDGNAVLKDVFARDVQKKFNTKKHPSNFVFGNENRFMKDYILVQNHVSDACQERLHDLCWELWFVREWNSVRKKINPNTKVDEFKDEKPYL